MAVRELPPATMATAAADTLRQSSRENGKPHHNRTFQDDFIAVDDDGVDFGAGILFLLGRLECPRGLLAWFPSQKDRRSQNILAPKGLAARLLHLELRFAEKQGLERGPACLQDDSCGFQATHPGFWKGNPTAGMEELIAIPVCSDNFSAGWT